MSIKLDALQGSILLPLFSLILINDLVYEIKTEFKLFIDDTTLYDANYAKIVF